MRDQEKNWISQHQRSAFTKTFRNFALACWIRVDSISERYVKKALDSLAKQGKTIIVIAHRLSTIKTANNIIVLNQGKVAESGNHQTLLALNGIYSRLWHEQFDEI